jgi:hypothetical protein
MLILEQKEQFLNLGASESPWKFVKTDVEPHPSEFLDMVGGSSRILHFKQTLRWYRCCWAIGPLTTLSSKTLYSLEGSELSLRTCVLHTFPRQGSRWLEGELKT